MINGNSKYLSVPHGQPENLKKSVNGDSRQGGIDRNKIYSMRSSNPIVIPSRITDIPG